MDLIDQQEDLFEDNGDLAEGITRVATVNYDDYTYRTYTSSLNYEETEAEFIEYIESEGYVASEDYEDVADFFMTKNGVGHGGEVYEDEQDYKYIYFTGSDNDMQIFTMIANKDTVANAHDETDKNGNGNGNDDPYQLPDEDVPGKDLSYLERYPDAVRVSYTEVMEESGMSYYIEYVVEASMETVFNDYKNYLIDHDWDITEEIFVPEDGGQFIAYYAEQYGLTLGFSEEAPGFVRIHVYITEYTQENE